MTRILLVVLGVALLPAASGAGDTVIHLDVRPMPAAKPALRFQLMPELRELNPGNPAQNYLKCFAEQRNFFYGPEANADRERYLTMPLAELPVEKLRGYGGSALRQADWAARLDAPDWQILQQVQTDGLELAALELGRLQLLGPALQVRFRGEVAGRRFDDAVRTAKTMFALARHLGEHPTEQGNRIGLSIAHLALAGLNEMVQQPDCPNLYWALTDLPCPLVEVRKGLQGNCALVAAELKQIQEDSPMTADQLEAVIHRLSGRIGFARAQAGEAPKSLRTALMARARTPEQIRAASGPGEPVTAKLSPLQAALVEAKREYEVECDENLKLLSLAPWQIDALTASPDARTGGQGLLADLLPNVIRDRREQGRLEQRIAMLRHVEAIRIYAADHGGRLPASLSEIPLPLPSDPFTGKPFTYKSEAMTCHVCGSPPRGEEQNPCFNVRYELTFRN